MRRSMSKDEISSIEVSEFDSGEKLQSQLPPIDRGRRAWSFLIGAFMIEGLLYGQWDDKVQCADSQIP
jgi:hypothetical protein